MTNNDYILFTVPIRAAAAPPTTWRPAIDAHCLAVGGTTEERATLLSAIAADFSAVGWSVQRGDTIEKQREIVTDIWVLMEQRYSQLMSDPSSREMLDPILLVVDEGEALTRAARAEPEARAVTEQLRDLLSLARSAKIHVLLGANTPDMELLSADMRDNLAVRIPVDGATRDHQLMRA